MNETLKEKSLRFLLIGFFILITIVAFLYRQDKQSNKEFGGPPLVLVLQPSLQTVDNPVVGLYEYKNNQHVLGIYEIERANHYKFTAKHVIELDDAPEQLNPDKSRKGIWAQLNGEWSYFNASLQLEKRSSKMRNSNMQYEIPFTFNENESAIIINDTQSITLKDGEIPRQLHSLSVNQLTWLIVTDNGVNIATIETR